MPTPVYYYYSYSSSFSCFYPYMCPFILVRVTYAPRPPRGSYITIRIRRHVLLVRAPPTAVCSISGAASEGSVELSSSLASVPYTYRRWYHLRTLLFSLAINPYHFCTSYDTTLVPFTAVSSAVVLPHKYDTHAILFADSLYLGVSEECSRHN